MTLSKSGSRLAERKPAASFYELARFASEIESFATERPQIKAKYAYLDLGDAHARLVCGHVMVADAHARLADGHPKLVDGHVMFADEYATLATRHAKTYFVYFGRSDAEVYQLLVKI